MSMNAVKVVGSLELVGINVLQLRSITASVEDEIAAPAHGHVIIIEPVYLCIFHCEGPRDGNLWQTWLSCPSKVDSESDIALILWRKKIYIMVYKFLIKLVTSNSKILFLSLSSFISQWMSPSSTELATRF